MDDLLHGLALNRQRALSRELTVIANNVANVSTTGYRREGAVFSEFVSSVGAGDSVSMGHFGARYVASDPGEIAATGRALDLAIEGDGFFVVARGQDTLLTRAGAFQVSSDGVLVAGSGERVLDDAGAEIFVPPDAAGLVVAADGTIGTGDRVLGRVAIMTPDAPATIRAAGSAFRFEGGLRPATGRIAQGALEGSNVDPVNEVARMIEVTRAYERVQSLVEDHDSRIRNVLETLGRAV